MNTVGRTNQPSRPSGVPSPPTSSVRLVDADVDVALNAIPLLPADHGADGGFRIARITAPDLSDGDLSQLFHFAEPAPRHQDARTGDACLPAVHEACPQSQRNGACQIGIVENDGGRLAAELECDAFHRVCAGAQDRLADCGRAGEGDLGHIGMTADLGADHVAAAGDDVEHAGRQSGRMQRLGDNLRLDRAHLAGFDDGRAAGGDGGRELAANEPGIAVPGRDGGPPTPSGFITTSAVPARRVNS